MTAPIDTSAPMVLHTADEDVTQAITVFTDVLEQLQDSHRLLEARALHMEAELCRTNGELEAKVEELDRVKRHLEAVLTAIPTGVVVYDAAGRVIRANDAATEILGTERTDLADAAAMAAVAGDVTDGSPTEVTCGDGAVRVLARRARPSASGDEEAARSRSSRTRPSSCAPRSACTASTRRPPSGPWPAARPRDPQSPPRHPGIRRAALPRALHRRRLKAFRHARRIREGVSEIEGIVA